MSDEKTLVGAVKTEQGVEVKGMLMQPVVEKCEGCDRVRTFEEQQFCGRVVKPFGSVLLAGMHRNFFENARLWKGRSPKAGGGFVFPLSYFPKPYTRNI